MRSSFAAAICDAHILPKFQKFQQAVLKSRYSKLLNEASRNSPPICPLFQSLSSMSRSNLYQIASIYILRDNNLITLMLRQHLLKKIEILTEKNEWVNTKTKLKLNFFLQFLKKKFIVASSDKTLKAINPRETLALLLKTSSTLRKLILDDLDICLKLIV